MYREGSDLSTQIGADVVYVCVDEDRFNQLTADLDAARRVSARQALAMATVGHDLRQNVQTILLSLDLVKCGVPDEEHLAWLSIACDQAKTLINGLEELATEANLGAYTAQRERSSFSIGEVLSRVEEKWSIAAAAKNLRFHIDRCATHVRSNMELLTTVVDNLVGNAMKYTERGSVGIHLTTQGSVLMISVQDTGSGISENDIETIFDPYWRGNATETGMGLGLAIVQSTASLLDHRVSVNSRVGRGSCFTVHVPLAPCVLSSGHPSGAARAPVDAPLRNAGTHLSAG